MIKFIVSACGLYHAISSNEKPIFPCFQQLNFCCPSQLTMRSVYNLRSGEFFVGTTTDRLTITLPLAHVCRTITATVG